MLERMGNKDARGREKKKPKKTTPKFAPPKHDSPSHVISTITPQKPPAGSQ